MYNVITTKPHITANKIFKNEERRHPIIPNVSVAVMLLNLLLLKFKMPSSHQLFLTGIFAKYLRPLIARFGRYHQPPNSLN